MNKKPINKLSSSRPLAQTTRGHEVQCPWHGSRFDIRTGKVVRPLAMRSEPTYEIKKKRITYYSRKRTNPDQS
jgi:nitrite reductase/ring-hydroxylating ferredoxin subunit